MRSLPLQSCSVANTAMAGSQAAALQQAPIDVAADGKVLSLTGQSSVEERDSCMAEWEFPR